MLNLCVCVGWMLLHDASSIHHTKAIRHYKNENLLTLRDAQTLYRGVQIKMIKQLTLNHYIVSGGSEIGQRLLTL